MKIAAHIIGCHQVSPEDYQKDIQTFLFDSSQSLDEIIAVTGEKDVSCLNLSMVHDHTAIIGNEAGG